jgi:hypothetical protein
MFTEQEKGLLAVVLVWMGMAATVALLVLGSLPTKSWGEYANSGPIQVEQGAGKGISFPRK